MWLQSMSVCIKKTYLAMIRIWILGVVCVYATLITGCSENEPKNTQTQNHYCFSGGDLSCISENEKGKAIISLSEKMAIEQPLRMRLEIEAASSITSIRTELEGENMYMGTIPVPLTHANDGSWQGELMVVACSRPDMLWRIQSHVTFDDGSDATFHWLFEIPR